MFGIPVKRMQSHEATGIGSAMAAFVGMGEFKNYEEAQEAMVHLKDVFEPDMEQHQIYHDLYHDVYQNIYGKLVPLYEKLHEIYHKKIGI